MGYGGARRPTGLAAADRGSATIWVAIACLVTWSVALFALSVGGVIAARHRAASAADLAALAGAQTLVAGGGDPCVAAQRVAAAAGARVVACDVLANGSLQVWRKQSCRGCWHGGRNCLPPGLAPGPV